MSAEPVLAVRGLSVVYRGNPQAALDDVAFEVAVGECVGVVGASGCGKSSLALALLGLLPAAAHLTRGSIRLQGREVGGADEATWQALRGRAVGLVFQDAGKALDPLYTVRFHLVEAGVHSAAVVQALDAVGLDVGLLDRRPHQLSGGQRQRVMVAVAAARSPPLLVADEPTASLDATTQLTVLHALAAARTRAGSALLLISHDLGVISRMADRLLVLDHGHIVETGPAARLLTAPGHPVTRALVEAQS